MNGFQNPYLNPYGMMSYGQVQQPVQMPASQQMPKLNGRNGAMQYAMGPNSSAWIMDENEKISWRIMTDGAGYKTILPYDVTPHEDVPAPDLNTLENRIKRLEELINADAKDRNPAPDQANDQVRPYVAKPAGGYEPADAEQPAAAAAHAVRKYVRPGPYEPA